MVKSSNEWIGGIASYYYALYDTNRKLIDLCGLDAFNMHQIEKDLIDIAININVIIPYKIDTNKSIVKIDKSEGILDF